MNIVSSEFKADPFPFLARLNKLLSEPSLVSRPLSNCFVTLTLGVIGSANRDETAFENPNDLQITREPTRCRME